MYRITVDVGGTFTDVVVTGSDGRLALGKALTDPVHVFDGIRAALEVAATSLGVTATSVIAEASIFVYASTLALNAIIEGETARTALVVTHGFRDVLVLREGGRTDPFDFTRPYPEPYVPRSLTFEVDERISSEGEIVRPLDEAGAIDLLRHLRTLDIEAIAVSLLWSVANPVHERRVGELVQAHLPGVPFTLSHELNPIVREYRRTSSTAIDASLKPLMSRHLGGLAAELSRSGFRGAAYAATSAGGLVGLDSLESAPVFGIRSGPSMAPLAARQLAEAEGVKGDLVVCDAGGTSFDISVVQGGRIKVSREAWLGRQYEGHITAVSAVDVRSVGAGGGSIGWRDAGGMLRVGPQSAGSSPGPACYGRGGTDPTVTDAAVVLGYLDPAYFLGGRMAIDEEAARTAVGRLAASFGLDLVEMADGIMRVAGEHMIRAVLDITVSEGLDPRECLIVAGGGAAGLNIAQVAREIGCRRILVPRVASTLSAYGAQYGDVVATFGAARRALTSAFVLDEANDVLEELEERASTFAARLHESGLPDTEIRYSVDARYPGQVWELPIDLEGSRFDDPEQVRRLEARFHDAHRSVFGTSDPAQGIECVHWESHVRGILPKPRVGERAQRPDAGRGSPTEERECFFSPEGWRTVPVVRSDAAQVGRTIQGPAVIEEPGTTIVVYPGSSAVMSPDGNLLLTVEPAGDVAAAAVAPAFV